MLFKCGKLCYEFVKYLTIISIFFTHLSAMLFLYSIWQLMKDAGHTFCLSLYSFACIDNFSKCASCCYICRLIYLLNNMLIQSLYFVESHFYINNCAR